MMKLEHIEDRRRFFAAVASLSVSVILLGVKFWAFQITRSQAVLSDALESIVNVAAAALALFVIVFAAQPADREHPYGHGKIEYFSAAFEGGLISFAALFIIFQAARAWMLQQPVSDLAAGALILAVTGLANLVLGLFLLRVGRRYDSLTLKASGHHVVSDFWTTAAVVGGLIVVNLTGLKWLDPLVAILMGLQLAWVGYGLVRYSAGGLLDEEDREVLRRLRKVFKRNFIPGVIQIHHTRVIRSGRYHHIDAHVVVPEFWDVAHAHDQMSLFEKKVIHDYPQDGEVHVHMDPCRRAYCRVCDLPDCPVRAHAFEGRTALTLEELTDPNEPEPYRK